MITRILMYNWDPLLSESLNKRSKLKGEQSKRNWGGSPILFFACKSLNHFQLSRPIFSFHPSISMKLLTTPSSLSSIVSVIKSAIADKYLLFGESLHAHLAKTGLSHETHVCNHLLQLYTKCNKLNNAHKLFGEMPEWDLVSYSVMISSASSSGNPSLSLEFLKLLYQARIRPNKYVLSSSILACCKLNSLNLGHQLHAQAIISGNGRDPYVSTALIDMYSKNGYIEPATKIFKSCSEKDAVMITSLISNYITFGVHEEALILFVQAMRDLNFRPTEFTFSILVKACLEMERETGEQIHGFIVKTGFDTCRFVGTSLLDFYAQCEEVESMEKVIDGVPYTDIALYNALIGGYSKNGFNEVALGCLEKISSIGLSPNEGTLSSIVNACRELKSLSIGAMVHGLVEKTRFRQDLVVNNALIDMYMKFGTVGDACKVFDSMPVRNTIVYNTMIFGHGQNSNFEESMVLYNMMRHERLCADVATFVSLASSCIGHEWSVFAHAIRFGFGTDVMVGNAILDSLLRSGASKDGMEFFEKLESRTIISWTTIISGLANTGFDVDSVNLFKTMHYLGIRSNGFTFSSVLKSCSNVADISLGRCIHGISIKYGCGGAFTTCALIDMYTKCGTLGESKGLFDTIGSNDKNLVHWNAMITGLSRNGYGYEALELYADMVRQNVAPDCVTFVSLLSACSRCGLVEAGIGLFDEMRYKYGIRTSIEHFACMVDLYGRAGLLDQALDFINNMPFKPDGSIWAIFFGACKIHGNLELAKFAMKKLNGLEASNYRADVVMCNIFSKLGKWDDAQIARRYGSVKEPGLSWVV